MSIQDTNEADAREEYSHCERETVKEPQYIKDPREHFSNVQV